MFEVHSDKSLRNWVKKKKKTFKGTNTRFLLELLLEFGTNQKGPWNKNSQIIKFYRNSVVLLILLCRLLISSNLTLMEV